MNDVSWIKRKDSADQWASTTKELFKDYLKPALIHSRHMGILGGKRLLDLGCGAGEKQCLFCQKKERCVVSDYSLRMVALQLAVINK